MNQSLSRNQYEILIEKLDLIIRLLTALVIGGIEKQKDRILRLSDAGIKASQISKLLGILRGTVTKDISRARKERTKIEKEASSNEESKN